MANRPKDRKVITKAAVAPKAAPAKPATRKAAIPTATPKAPASRKQAKPAKTKPAALPPMHELTAAYANAVASVKTLAEAHAAALSDTCGMLTARANGCNKAPTQILKVGDEHMICYLMEDCSYGNCQPYQGPID